MAHALCCVQELESRHVGLVSCVRHGPIRRMVGNQDEEKDFSICVWNKIGFHSFSPALGNSESSVCVSVGGAIAVSTPESVASDARNSRCISPSIPLRDAISCLVACIQYQE